ncbi:PRC-barrel domain-containing protein [Geoglobus sp.]
MVLAREMLNKVVLLSDGTIVGVVHTLTFDFKTGSLVNVVVRPKNEVEGLKKEDGYYIIPFESVRSVSDYVVIDRKRI